MRANVASPKDFRMVRMILISLLLLILQVFPSLLLADDHKTGNKHLNQHEIRKEHNNSDHNSGGQVEKGAEGNETTGQIAAWLLVSANLTVLFSIITKGANRFLPLKPQTKNSIKAFNQLQKKYLMRFHFLLNPIALCVAFFHFLLSSCRSSPLPEWGLLLVTMMVALGLVLKFKIAPGWVRRVVHRLHTSPVTFSMMILLVVVGHLVSD
jgi:hypothetical protein